MFRPLTDLGPNRRISIRACAAALIALVALTAGAEAQSTSISARKQPVKIAVVGDSVANDLGRGLEALFENKRGVQIIKKTQFATGLVRTDFFDWNTTVRTFFRQNDPDVVLVIMGGNDNQAMRIKGRRLEPSDKAWRAEYERRVARFMKNFKQPRTQIYWVSLPPVRSDRLTNAYRVMNRIYERQATKYGFHYLNVWDKFLTKGAYSSFGQSLEGVRRQIRKQDGMHFTDAGTVLFASYVANAIGLR